MSEPSVLTLKIGLALMADKAGQLLPLRRLLLLRRLTR